MLVGDERSEEPPPLDTIKDNWYTDKGGALSSECPRKGSMLMEDWQDRRYLVNTVCNSWRCLGCRERNRNRFKAMVAFGCSSLGRSCFITITYKAGVARLEDAGCVAKDWKALWRLLKKSALDLAKSPWLRVMELTKEGTPHFHVLMGLSGDREVRCWGASFDVKRYVARLASCDCVAHVVGRAWAQVQLGESYIVHATPVKSSWGAGGYLAKYMEKDFAEERAKTLGMARRWSTSRSWPREPRARLEQSLALKGWKRTSWRGGHVQGLDSHPEEHFPGVSFELGKRKETEGQRKRKSKASARRLVRMLGDMQDVNPNEGSENVSKERGSG